MTNFGVFIYSKEEGTPAAKLKNQVHHNTKKKRYNIIMKLAERIAADKAKEHIGKTYEVLIESETSDGKHYIGRTYMDIPDTDGVVLINVKDNSSKTLAPLAKGGREHSGRGDFVNCRIIDAGGYDLIGRIVK